jgi:hypothetical protein
MVLIEARLLVVGALLPSLLTDNSFLLFHPRFRQNCEFSGTAVPENQCSFTIIWSGEWVHARASDVAFQ